MGLSTEEQVRYWGVAAAVFVLFLWFMGNTLLPFVVGAAIAYLLDPVADWLENHGLSRGMATALVTLFVVFGIAVFLLIVVPLVANQIRGIAEAVPTLIQHVNLHLTERYPALFDEDSAVRRALVSMEDTLRDGGVKLVQTVLSSSLALLDVVLLLVLAPVIAFYLLMDWDRMIAALDALVPREHVATVRRLARDVDAVLSGFVRGQLTVCAVLGSFYAIALAVVGLQFGVVVGLFAGLISFIPFVGSITGGVLSIGLALFQFWGEWQWIVAVAAIFVVGQLVEGNVLTPKLVGDSVGLHPVWLIFALTAFGALFGFAGMLIAVPVAAVIGVMGRFGIRQYKQGRLYLGPEGADRQDAAE